MTAGKTMRHLSDNSIGIVLFILSRKEHPVTTAIVHINHTISCFPYALIIIPKLFLVIHRGHY